MTGLLIGYGLIQLSSLFVRSPAILLAYELSYLAAIVVGIIWSIKKSKEDKDLKTFGGTILLFADQRNTISYLCSDITA